jgi:hypothetical protein
MGITKNLCAQSVVAAHAAPNLGPSDEEPLFAGESVDY